jgi:hypothetical protein
VSDIEVIREARSILSDPNAWGKGAARPTPQAWCAVGALSLAIGRLPAGDGRRRESYLRDVAELVESHIPHDAESHRLSIYNDDPRTTHQDILNVFDKTLADLGGLA